MKNKSLYKATSTLALIASIFFLYSCEKYLEIPNPTNSITQETAFLNKGTTDKVMNYMYNAWASTGGVALNYTRSIEYFSDNAYNPTVTMYPEQTGELNPESIGLSISLWASMYSSVYAANLLLEGLPTAEGLDEATRNSYTGAALTIRACAHYYLVRSFGEVPVCTSTDVTFNSALPRMPVSKVYEQVIADLTEAVRLLPATGPVDRRFIDNKNIPQALLARVYTTLGNWVEAEKAASAVIGSGKYQLVTNLSNVFTRTSPEVINSLGSVITISAAYQNSTAWGRGAYPANNSGEASYPALSTTLLSSFETGDLRKTTWVFFRNGGNYSNPNNRYFQKKYLNPSAGAIPAGKEQDFVLIRLAEMYLIRAEARARKVSPDLTGAAGDLNVVRTRAGLANTTAVTQQELINAVLKERRVELFFEGGFRWDDLIRTGTADAVIAPLAWKINWDSYKILMPIPQTEIYLNSKLNQNSGY